MKKKSTSQSAFFNLRVLIAAVFCLGALAVALLAQTKSAGPTQQSDPKPIDYNVHVGGNFITHKTWAWGKHDGYPSGVVFGSGQRIYEWRQNTTANLAPPM